MFEKLTHELNNLIAKMIGIKTWFCSLPDCSVIELPPPDQLYLHHVIPMSSENCAYVHPIADGTYILYYYETSNL